MKNETTTNFSKKMDTFTILLNSAKEKATIRVWGLSQQVYGHSKITMRELGKIQNQLRLTDPNFFVA
jgi:hypothetical protein